MLLFASFALSWLLGLYSIIHQIFFLKLGMTASFACGVGISRIASFSFLEYHYTYPLIAPGISADLRICHMITLCYAL
ncbi:hypothetical protein F4810DRAFT_645540 [Camillea tinctor]|nr:hypothetical protein F4810DRAFT_645540 [Camillea tinctor]